MGATARSSRARGCLPMPATVSDFRLLLRHSEFVHVESPTWIWRYHRFPSWYGTFTSRGGSAVTAHTSHRLGMFTDNSGSGANAQPAPESMKLPIADVAP
jgi:hypothetical protein